MVFQRLFKAIILHLWSFFGFPDGWGLRPFKSGNPLELTNRRDAAAASLRFRRFVSSAALPWLLSKTCLLERKTPHAMARSTITPRDDRKKLHVRIASLGIQSPRCHVSNRYNHHLAHDSRDDSRALRGGAPLEGRRTARGAQARRAGAARGPQDVNVVGRASLVEGPGAR